jgi:hypothetical protein
VAEGVGPEFKPQYCKKTKKEKPKPKTKPTIRYHFTPARMAII